MQTGYSVFFLLVFSVKIIICDVELRILRSIEETYSLVTFGVEEKAGNNLSLSCELISSGKEDYDDQIIWGKDSANLRFKNKTDLEILAKTKPSLLYSLVEQRELNRAQKIFAPLKPKDGGTYFCGSLKYMVFEVVHIVVRGPQNQTAYSTQGFRPNDGRETISFCSEKMFKCKSNVACINQNYVCDKKPDCPDGSDESFETCKGDPCENKLECDDGRCIPLFWCCDRNHDPECNVMYPPPCCQSLSESYEDFGNVPYNMTQARTNSTRYIFISLCILATFSTVVLMLLILSRVFLFAKKTSCSFELHMMGEVRNRLRADPGTVLSSDVPACTEALLILSDDIIRYGHDSIDRPPSYTDVMGTEPPPPYTSQDCLDRNEV